MTSERHYRDSSFDTSAYGRRENGSAILVLDIVLIINISIAFWATGSYALHYF